MSCDVVGANYKLAQARKYVLDVRFRTGTLTTKLYQHDVPSMDSFLP